MIQRKARGRDRWKRVYWNQMEKAVVVHEAAEIKLERPNITWGACLVEAQDRAISRGLLPPSRRNPEEPLRARAKAAFSRMVEEEVQRIIEQRNIDIAVQRANAGNVPQISPAEARQEAANEALHPDLSEMMRLGHQAVSVFLSPLINSMADEFQRRLEAEFRGRASAVLAQIAAGVNVVTPVENAVVLSPYIKPKVALVGNETDNSYFQRCVEGLEDLLEFIPVKSLGDTIKTKDCSFVVTSGNAIRAVKTALEQIAKGAKFLHGKASSSVKTELTGFAEDAHQKYLDGLSQR